MFPPERVVCLTEETVETLYLLGEERRIVGVSGYAVRPPQVRKEKPRVSAFISANVPKILALEPDLVLTFSDLQAPIVADLIRAGVAVHAFNQRDVAGILAMIRTVGALVGATGAAEALAAEGGPLALAGDSAGGGLALAALVALRDRTSVTPVAGWLISPWADLTQSGATYDTRVEVDPMLHRDGLTQAAGEYLGPDGDPSDPLASPMSADLAGLPPVRIDVGDAEVLLDDAVVTGHRIDAAERARGLEHGRLRTTLAHRAELLEAAERHDDGP